MADAVHEIPVCFICKEEVCDHSEDQQLEFLAADMSGAPAPVLASDAKHTAVAAKKLKGRENREISDVQWLMSHANGRRIMWGLIERCALMNNSYVRAKASPNILADMCFIEGARNVGNEYFALVTAHAKADYFKMLEENGK